MPAITTYNPRQALYTAFPKMKTLSQTVDPTMNAAEGELTRRELAGEDTSLGSLADLLKTARQGSFLTTPVVPNPSCL